MLWTWSNPRLFGKPNSLDSWASKSVLGERIWINRDEVSVPERHRRAPNVLNAVSGTGMSFVVWGVVQLSVWPTLFGMMLVYAGKLWFLHRMVWLYEDMKHAPPRSTDRGGPGLSLTMQHNRALEVTKGRCHS